MNRLYSESQRVCDFLLYNTPAINALLHIKWIIDWAMRNEIPVPVAYIDLHCHIIDTHDPSDLVRDDPIYENVEQMVEDVTNGCMPELVSVDV